MRLRCKEAATSVGYFSRTLVTAGIRDLILSGTYEQRWGKELNVRHDYLVARKLGHYWT